MNQARTVARVVSTQHFNVSVSEGDSASKTDKSLAYEQLYSWAHVVAGQTWLGRPLEMKVSSAT